MFLGSETVFCSWFSAAPLVRFVFQLDNSSGPFLTVHGVFLQAQDRNSAAARACAWDLREKAYVHGLLSSLDSYLDFEMFFPVG